MINLKKISVLAAAIALLAPAVVYAHSSDNYDVVRGTYGDIVLSTNGNCVYTMWPSRVDECGGHARHRFSKLTQEQRTVYFGFNRSTLNAHEKRKLDEVSSILLSSKEVSSVDIVGYTDKIGKSSYNKRLSLRRAETVKSYLARKGLRTRHVRVEGLGETGSYTHCDAKMSRKELIACLAPDRRAEIEVNVRY